MAALIVCCLSLLCLAVFGAVVLGPFGRSRERKRQQSSTEDADLEQAREIDRDPQETRARRLGRRRTEDGDR